MNLFGAILYMMLTSAFTVWLLCIVLGGKL